MSSLLKTKSTLLLPASTRSLSNDAALIYTALRTHLVPCTQIALWRLSSDIALPIYLALHQVGCTPVWLNSRWTLTEASHAIAKLGVRSVILPRDENFAQGVPRLHVWRDEHGNPILKSGRTTLQPQFTSSDALPAQSSVFFTSGTTSVAKPVLLSYSAVFIQARTKIKHIGFNSSTVYLHLAPFYHVGGFSSALSITLVDGMHVFPPEEWHPMSHSAQLLAYAEEKGVNTLVVVPTVLQLMVDVGKVMEQITSILYGAGKLSARLLEQTRTQFPHANIIGAYGMTETASSISFLHHNDFDVHSPLHRSVGRPPAHIQVQIDPKTGEVLTTGPNVMAGYVGGKPLGKWLRTGDVGYMKHGALFLSGRIKDMIKTGGENVFAAEVEDALLKCAQVREAAVVGVPHRLLGEAVVAAVVVDSECNFRDALTQLEKICKHTLTSFKRPKWIVQQSSLPRNNMGKVVKEIVRQRVEGSLFPRAKL